MDKSKHESLCRTFPCSLSDGINIRSKFECPICYECLRDPVLTICGHRFCEKCITQWLGKDGRPCPIDQQLLGLKDIFPDNCTKREILESRIPCYYGCENIVPLIELDDHLKICDNRRNIKENGEIPSVCQEENFQTDLSNGSLFAHAKECSNLQLMLKETKNLKENMNTCLNNCVHTEKCLSYGKKCEAASEELLYYINDVYEKLTELDQRSKEYVIKQDNMAIQLERYLSETNGSKSVEMSNGLLVWKICKFDEMLRIMNDKPGTSYYSPAFSTSQQGYCFRLRLRLSSKNHEALALVWHMIKGKYDFILKWPFIGAIVISIIHPVDPNLRLESMIKTNTESEAFQRPSLDINPCGFGFPETNSIPYLYKKGYLQNNALTIVASVRSLN